MRQAQLKKRAQKSALAIAINTKNTSKGHFSKSKGGKIYNDLFQVTYYNCIKKNHFANKYLKLNKAKN